MSFFFFFTVNVQNRHTLWMPEMIGCVQKGYCMFILLSVSVWQKVRHLPNPRCGSILLKCLAETDVAAG